MSDDNNNGGDGTPTPQRVNRDRQQVTPIRLMLNMPVSQVPDAEVEKKEDFENVYKRYKTVEKSAMAFDPRRHTMEQYLADLESAIQEADLPLSWAVNLSISKLKSSDAHSERSFVESWLEGRGLNMATARKEVRWTNTSFQRGVAPSDDNKPGWKEILLGMSIDTNRRDKAIRDRNSLKVTRDPMTFLRNFERLYVMAAEDAPRSAIIQLLDKLPSTYANLRREILQYRQSTYRAGGEPDIPYLCQHLRDCYASRGEAAEEESVGLNNLGRSHGSDRRSPKKSDFRLPRTNAKGEPLCFVCKKYGHMAKDCRTKTTRSINNVQTTADPSEQGNAKKQ